LHDTAPYSVPEEPRVYREKPSLRWLGSVVRGIVLVILVGGGAYFAQNPAAVQDMAFKVADWGLKNEAYGVSLQIFEYYDSPSDAQTPFRVAVLYEEGKGADANKKEAFAWYQKSAKRGNAAAALKLAQMLERGEGADANVDLATEWYREAAEKGQAEAQYRLGIAYLREDALNLSPNPSESVKWLRQAAMQGHKQARELLRLTR
jgi:hypothetical protein